MLPLTAAMSYEHRGAQCLLILTRSTSPPRDQFPLRVCSCALCIINRLWTGLILMSERHCSAKPDEAPSRFCGSLWRRPVNGQV